MVAFSFTRPSLYFLFCLMFFGMFEHAAAQSGTEFWLAPPDITDLHNAPGGEPLYLLVSSTGQASTVTIDQPANGSFIPIVVNVAANKSIRVNLTPFKSQLETRPTNTILNTGLHITATTTITCYYECANTNNTDIWALKGPNAEGTEFYVPLHKHAPFNNEASFASPHQAFASFDICATQNNTVVTIYSPTPVDGHPALQQFTVSLNRGQTYSCGFTGTNWSQPSTHPSGAIVLADKPITVSLKDDSDHNPSGGCYDILGDQIVPVDVVGEDYIAVKGSLNNTGDESVVLMATQNNTQVFVDGNATPLATLFAGEYYRIDMDSLSTSANNALYVHCTKPTYAMHITGFGCEMGMAQLPPLNCAGSQQLNFLRDDAQTFYITVLCRANAVNGFTVTGPGTATIPPASFVTVPGTGGIWKAAKITYNTTQVPVDSTFKVSNSIDVFALGVVNGGATSGCKYGYFSEFVAPIVAYAGIDQTICANTTTTLAGAVSGGTITGQWTSSGTGSFSPNSNALNAVYTPSAADAATGSVVLTLTSTGACIPVSDQMTLTITPAPTASAGSDQSKCANNANVSLTGAVTIATGGVWTGGLGSFLPSNNVLSPVYVPTSAEIASGSITLTLTTTGNGICNPVSDNITIVFTQQPVVNAGADRIVCGNNPASALSGSVTVASGGVWTGGGGSFVPSATSLNPVYTATAAEILAGSVTLTLTSTGNLNCNPVSDNVTISFSAPPVITAGADQVKCANNAATTLAGNVSGASGGQWSGGLGIFIPNNNSAVAVYTPTSGEIASGIVALTFTSTGNGTCNAVNDQMNITFTAAPTANAGIDQVVCANNPAVILNGSFTVASGASWSGGTGSFNPGNTAMNANYIPSASEIAAGSVMLTLTTTGNGTCNEVTDQVLITITPSPIVNAGPDQTKCANNATVNLAGSVATATGGSWSGGAGTFNPSTAALNATYTPTASEISSGSIILTLTSTGNGGCNAVSDQVTIFFSSSPTSSAGVDQTLCANNAVTTLAGNVNVAGGGQWSGGLGIFLPNNNTLNATYTPTTTEISSGSVQLTLTTTSNGSCNAVNDQVTLSFTSAPTVNAGNNSIVCGNNEVTNLSGSFTTAAGAIWSGGNGAFLPNNTSMVATYTPTPSEISAGAVTLTLTSTGNGTCATVSDQVLITITPIPTVNAGLDQTRCANNTTASLTGNVTVASGGLWSGGAGTFNPSASSLNAVYTPTPQEVANGSVTLTLTSTGNGICNQVSDQVTIFYSSQPTVSAGPDQSLCANNAIVNLTGNVTTAGGGQWSGGLGVFSPDNNSLSAIYTPSAAEIASGSLALTLTTTSNGGCNAVSDAIILFFTPAPVVSVSSNQTVCENNPQVSLNGTFTVASGAVWTGGSGTFSPNNTSSNILYNPSANDITTGSVVLTYTTTGNGNCTAVSDHLTVTITPAPVVNAGANINACANNASVLLSGQVTNASGGVWSGGLGSFSPNANALNATYSPTNAEIIAGSVMLTLTSTGNGNCNAVSDDMTISFSPAPTVSAGSDLVLCGNNEVATLNGTHNFSTGVQWSGGFGLFSPSSTAAGADYTPTAGEIATGFVNLILTSTGNGNCFAVSDTLHITYTPAPFANAGADLSSCANSPAVLLNGNFVVANGALWSGGQGSFSPSNTSMNAQYIPSSGEVAAGGLTLTLTTTSAGNCLPASDQVNIVIIAAPIVNAGADQLTCISNLNVGLSGSISGPTNTGIWTSTGSGIFVPNNTTLNATYQCSNADVIAGSVNLTLTSTFNGSCLAVSDQMSITILPPGGANAGNDQTVCGNNATIALNGIVTGGASTGTWGTTGTGTFANSQLLNTTYAPSSFDILNGSVTLYLNANSCNYASDSLVVSITHAPVVSVGSDITICSSESSVELNGIVSGGSTSGIWTGNGTGFFSPSNSSLIATYHPSDSDILAQNISLYLTSSFNGQCQPSSDTLLLHIFPSGGVAAGNDQVLCANNANVSLNGSLSGGATIGQWTSSGSGVFLGGDGSLLNVYQPSNADLNSGSVTLTLNALNSCNPASDEVFIEFTLAPTVNAGTDIQVCANNPVVDLDGSFTISTGAIWSGGDGSFIPSNVAMNAQYIPSPNEIQSGGVSLTLSSEGNGQCLAVTDVISIVILPSPVVSAGADQTTCITDLTIALNGSVSGITNTGVWSSSGSGVFTPSVSALNAVYTLSSQDSINGGVVITLTSSNSLMCNAVSDAMVISIVPAGTAYAGEDVVVCGNNAEIDLSGVVGGGATNGSWTTNGTGTFFPNNNALNAVYIPSDFDITSGQVSLALTANTCTSTSDTLSVMITPVPLVNAGTDQTICATTDNIALNGAVSGGSTSGIWTTNGSGVFLPSASDLNAVYTPSASDVINQNIQLILTSSSNGNCSPVSDTMILHIFPLGSSLAGADQILCSNNANVILNGALGGGATTGMWSTSGSGIFIPNVFALNATYVASAGDLLSGGVIIGLNATNSCNNAIDFLSITYTAQPIADAGPAQTFCGNNPSFNLNGNIANATGGVWSGGSGIFSPSSNVLNPMYSPSLEERTQGYVVLTLSSAGNGNCIAVSDTVTLYMSTGIVANAGPDQQVCESAPYTQLQGVVSNGATTGTWSTLGSGTFSPGQNALNALYMFSPADLVAGDVTLILTSSAGGSCFAATDTMHITFGQSAFAFAGNDQAICASENEISLHGFVTGGASAGVWSSSGNGIFSPDNSTLVTNYTITDSDRAAGEVLFILTSSDNGSCLPGVDSLLYQFTQPSFVSAGGDLNVCANSVSVDLGATVSGASNTGLWTSLGSGSFSDNTQLNTIYTASANDVLNENVILILRASDTGPCPADADSLVLSIHAVPSVNAGSDLTLCGSVPSIALSGSINSGATAVMWSTTGSGNFSPNASTLNASYLFSASDVLNGGVDIIISSTEQGVCAPASDTISIVLIPVSEVSAGNDLSVCEDDMEVILNGVVSGASVTGQWTTTGSGSFVPDASTLNATYVPGIADSLSGNVLLILHAIGTGICSADSDSLNIVIQRKAIVSAGSDQSICSSQSVVNLNGTFGGGATSILWTTNGSGTFSPDNVSSSATYSMSSSDIANGSIAFVISADGEGVCGMVTDTMLVVITQGSTVNAGNDISICSDNLNVPLAASVTGSFESYTWSTTGSGIFSPDNTSLNATYIAGANDSLIGHATLILAASGSGSCADAIDTLEITITNPASVNAGPDQTMCATTDGVALNGMVTGGSTSGIWSSSGSGVFSPDVFSLNAVYHPSLSDVSTGTVTLTLSSTGNGLCDVAIDELVVHLIQPATVNAGGDRVLCGETDFIQLSGSVLGNTSSGNWSTSGSGEFVDGGNTLNTTYSLSNADVINGDVALVLSSTNNSVCPAVSDTMHIFIEEMPVAAFSTVAGDALDIQFNDESIGAVGWLWDFGIGGSSASQNPSVIYPAIGYYEVSLIIFSEGGCTDTSSAIVQAIEPIGTPVAIPSGFSPNGDQSNDVLHVLGGPFKEVDFRIYNEWGNLVYSTTDPLAGWDGTYKGELQPGGVYVYTASGITVKGRYVRLSGNVTLIR